MSHGYKSQKSYMAGTTLVELSKVELVTSSLLGGSRVETR